MLYFPFGTEPTNFIWGGKEFTFFNAILMLPIWRYLQELA
jgi:hypothetical protein